MSGIGDPSVVRPLALSFLALWAGAVLLLSRRRWFARSRLTERLRPFSSPNNGHQPPAPTGAGVLSVESFRDVIGPLSRALGARLAHLFGISEELAVRLARVHSPLDVTAFRVRQVGWAVCAFATGAAGELALRPPALVAPLLLLGFPLLAFLALEQQLAARSTARQRLLFLELPIVAEQLAMLLSAGFSLGTSINRIAARSRGAVAQDLAVVCERIRHGLSEPQALGEWATTARVPAVDRLVAVLALNRESSDLSRLISDEAASLRRDAQRQVTELIDRRAQQVWIPVTIATLVPGAIFLAIPFTAALRLFAA